MQRDGRGDDGAEAEGEHDEGDRHGEEIGHQRARREKVEIADGEDEGTDPRGEDDPEGDAQPVPAPRAAFHRPAPQDSWEKGIGLGERLDPALERRSANDDDEDERERELEAGGEEFVCVEGKDGQRGGGKAVDRNGLGDR